MFEKVNPKLIKTGGVYFLWFTWVNGKYYAIHWECQAPVWWKPRLEIDEIGWRAGWLYFALGFSKKPVDVK